MLQFVDGTGDSIRLRLSKQKELMMSVNRGSWEGQGVNCESNKNLIELRDLYFKWIKNQVGIRPKPKFIADIIKAGGLMNTLSKKKAEKKRSKKDKLLDSYFCKQQRKQGFTPIRPLRSHT